MPKVIKGMPRWRSDELEILRQMAPQKTNAQLAEILVGRSLDSIAAKLVPLSYEGNIAILRSFGTSKKNLVIG